MSEKIDRVREYAITHPGIKYKDIAKALGVGTATVHRALVGYEPPEIEAGRRQAGSHLKDETGKRYGSLTVIKREANKWLCQCDCGGEILASGNDLRDGSVTRCGKCNRDKVYPGARFGALTVAELVPGKRQLWLCQCDCGNTTEQSESDLVGGWHTSCGCMANLYKRQAETSGRVEGTKLSSMTAALSGANTSGIKGVSWSSSRGGYTAQIKYKYKNYYLGTYASLEDAAIARRKAEEYFFDPMLEKYGRDVTDEERFVEELREAMRREKMTDYGKN